MFDDKLRKKYTSSPFTPLRIWCFSGVVLGFLLIQSNQVESAATEKYVPNTRNNRIERERQVLYEDPSETPEEEPKEGGSLFEDSGLGSLSGNGEVADDLVPGEKRLKCQACDGPHCESIYTCHNAVMCWTSRHRNSYGLEQYSKGCVNTRDRVPFVCSSRSHTKNSKQAHNQSNPDYDFVAAYINVCCDKGDYCNDGEFPELPEAREANSQTGLGDFDTTAIYIALGFTVIFFAVVIFITIKVVRRTHKKRMEELMKAHRENFYPLNDEELQAKSAGDSTLKEYLDGSMTSGSGSGLPLLIQRTLAKNIQLVECIGKGRFGEVWRAVWNCENVAVKIFATRDEASWIRETEIYSTVMLRHNNILGFYGSDMTSRNSVTQLWLVTHYHRNGSLYDFLNKKTIQHPQLFKLAYSLANGLAFLHSEMVGTESRPGIAHRDLKSKNILVGSNETCVIADFGMAVTHKRDTGELNVHPNPKVGTKRYMAPELLDDSMNMSSFDAYKRVDMYAFALVLWELCCRTSANGIAEEYQQPFQDVVNADPSFEEMKKVVCGDGYRPEIPNRWASDPVLAHFTRIIKESWHPIPAVRLSALRVKKTVAVLSQENCKGMLDGVTIL